MDSFSIADVFMNASPFVVLVAAIVYIVRLVFSFLAQRNEDNRLRRIEDQVSGDHSVLIQHTIESNQASSAMEKLLESQTALLCKIAQELVSLNAATTGSVISIDNAKNIIHYQWNWCRDETARLICNSIQNNHFRNRESIVARRVYAAWRKASITALHSVERFEGLRYPYRRLYLVHAPILWDIIWGWAVPLYHRRNEQGTIDADAAADLHERIVRLFDQAIAYYFELVEDIDTGELYNDSGQADPPLPGVSEGEECTTEMADLLRDYKVGEGSRSTSTRALGTLRHRMRDAYARPR